MLKRGCGDYEVEVRVPALRGKSSPAYRDIVREGQYPLAIEPQCRLKPRCEIMRKGRIVAPLLFDAALDFDHGNQRKIQLGRCDRSDPGRDIFVPLWLSQFGNDIGIEQIQDWSAKSFRTLYPAVWYSFARNPFPRAEWRADDP